MTRRIDQWKHKENLEGLVAEMVLDHALPKRLGDAITTELENPNSFPVSPDSKIKPYDEDYSVDPAYRNDPSVIHGDKYNPYWKTLPDKLRNLLDQRASEWIQANAGPSTPIKYFSDMPNPYTGKKGMYMINPGGGRIGNVRLKGGIKLP